MLNKKIFILKKLFFFSIRFNLLNFLFLDNFFLYPYLKNKNLFFFDRKVFYNYFNLLINFCKFFELFFLANFKWSRFVLFSGLGFKKKLSKFNRFICLFIGDRHWLIIPYLENLIIFSFRRRNFIFFSNSKTTLYYFNNLFKSFSRTNIFKVKGYLDVRTRRRWLFVRRLKLRGLKAKLSKKQKLI